MGIGTQETSLNADPLPNALAVSNKTPLVSDSWVLGLLPASMEVWQANLPACMKSKISDPSWLLTMLINSDIKDSALKFLLDFTFTYYLERLCCFSEILPYLKYPLCPNKKFI